MIGEKTLAEVVSELSDSSKAYKISVFKDVVSLSVDGIHG